MKIKFRKNFVTDLERGMVSYRFLICVCGAALMIVFGAWDQLFPSKDTLETGLAAGYHLSLVIKALKSEAAVFVLPILSTLPLSGIFLEEHKSRFEKLFITRCSRKNYILSKVLATALCGGLGILFGLLLITVILMLIYRPMEAGDAKVTGKLLLTLLQYGVTASLMGVLWASLGAFLGVTNMNSYMAYGGPFIISYLLIILSTRYFKDFYVLNPREWILREHYTSENPLGIIVLLLEICIIIMLMEGIAIWKKVDLG